MPTGEMLEIERKRKTKNQETAKAERVTSTEPGDVSLLLKGMSSGEGFQPVAELLTSM